MEKKYPGGGPYAGATARAHANHVHFATSTALAETILAKLRGTPHLPKPRSAKPASPKPTSAPQPTPTPVSKLRLNLPYIEAGSFGPARRKTQLLVIHATDNARASAEDEANYMTRRPDNIGCHVVVDRDSAVQTVPLDRVGYCAYPTANDRSIHMELCGVSNAVPSPTITRGAKLAAVICQLWGIPIVSLGATDLVKGVRGICGHDDVTAAWHTGVDAGASHTDPGPLFPWAAFVAQVQAEHNRLFATDSGVHIVRAGDTLSAIAARHSITMSAIKGFNPQIKDLNLIRVGDRVRIA